MKYACNRPDHDRTDNPDFRDGIERGKTEAVQQVTNIINDAKNETIPTSPLGEMLAQLRDKIQREVK